MIDTDIHTHEENKEFRYVGFWTRLIAFTIDNILLFIILAFLPIPGIKRETLNASTETMDSFAKSWSSSVSIDSIWGYLIIMVIILLFWRYRSATPGKMLFKAQIVDAKTGQRLTTGQSIIRYIGYFISSFFFLGFIWIAFDKRKQGFHDKLSGSVVIYSHLKP